MLERLLSATPPRRRALGILLVLACFSLPFHFHPATAASSHISNECTCLHGSRMEMGAAIAAFQCALPVYLNLTKSFEPQLNSQAAPGFRTIRAPPVR